MSDYIEIAPYVINISFIYESTLITEFVKKYGIENIKKMDLNFLRDYRIVSKEKCINLIDELALRGFIFRIQKPTNLLPSKIYEIENNCIFVKDNDERFKNVNFAKLGMANFVERFNVKSDYFFQYIKIDNFLHINNNLHLQILKEELLKCGFSFINKEDINTRDDSMNCNNTIENNSESKEDILGKERLELFFQGAREKKSLQSIKVNEVYHENIFNKFRTLCSIYGIDYMEQLKEMPFDDLIFFRGFGKEKVKNIIERYNEYIDHGCEIIKSCDENTKESIQDFIDKLNLNNITSGIKIETVFPENRFNLFRSFCLENKITYVECLRDFPFEALKSYKSFGKTRVYNIIERYEEYINGEFNPTNVPEDFKEFDNIEVNNYYWHIEIDGLKAINIDDSLINEFKNMGLIFIKDLVKLKYSMMLEIKGVGKTKINRFMTNIKLLCDIPENLMKSVLKEIKNDKDFEIFRARSIGKVTLQSLGKQHNLTRERIRQKEKNILILFQNFFMLFKNQIFGQGDKSILDIEDIRNIIQDDEEVLYIKYALMNAAYPAVVYFKEIDKFLINQSVDEVRNKLESIIEENIEDIYDFYNEMVNIDEILKEFNIGFIDIDDFLSYVKEKGFVECGNYLLRKGTSSRKIYSYILKEYFPDGVRYSDHNDIEEVLKIARKEFELERHTEDDIRALSAIIGENVLCDRGKYIHADHIDIPKVLRKNIKDYILEQPEDTVLMVDVFHMFENELRSQSNVNNRYFLHGILKYYYGEEFTFSRDKVSKVSGEVLSTDKILENFLMEQKGPVKKDRIREQFPGWSEVMLQNAEIINKNIINWDKGRMSCTEFLDITEEDNENLQKSIETTLEEHNGYCNAKIIYKKLQLKMNSFYKKNGITNYTNLFYVIKYLFDDIYYFRIPHILKEKPDKSIATQDIIFKIIEDRKIITYEEISQYLLNKLKMNESTMYAANRKVLNKLIEIRKGEYILKDTLLLDEDSVNIIREFIKNKLSEREYVPMLSIIDYRGLPDIGYEWNPFLLQDVIEENISEYRFIEKEFKDRRYRCSNIVKSNSNLKNIEDLIIYVLKNEYKDKENMTVQSIQQYLTLKYVIFNSLPYEFLNSQKVSIDEFHRVNIQ